MTLISQNSIQINLNSKFYSFHLLDNMICTGIYVYMKTGRWSYGFGAAGLAARGADEVKDGLGGFGEVGVFGELGVLLSFLHRSQEGPTVTALE